MNFKTAAQNFHLIIFLTSADHSTHKGFKYQKKSNSVLSLFAI